MKNLLVSVIVPIYNVEKYLRKCVDSILNQTYKNLEIILVDDGSPDNCGNICDEYALSDSRIRIIHKKNGGLSDARNAGLDIARGNYILFVDSDDYIDETMVEKLYEALEKEKAEMSLCSFVYVNEEGVPIKEKNNGIPIKTEVLSGIEAIRHLGSQRGACYTIACCKLYKAELFKTIRFPKGKYHEDEFVSHELFGQCSRVACIDDGLYYYVQRNDSIMGSSRLEVSVKDFDETEGLLKRALFILPLGMLRDSSKYYFDVVLRVSYLLTHCMPKSEQEKMRMKEMYSLIRKNYRLCKYCTTKEKVHIMLFNISPRLHQFMVRLLGK